MYGDTRALGFTITACAGLPSSDGSIERAKLWPLRVAWGHERQPDDAPVPVFASDVRKRNDTKVGAFTRPAISLMPGEELGRGLRGKMHQCLPHDAREVAPSSHGHDDRRSLPLVLERAPEHQPFLRKRRLGQVLLELGLSVRIQPERSGHDPRLRLAVQGVSFFERL
jgi:hypothetical protein